MSECDGSRAVGLHRDWPLAFGFFLLVMRTCLRYTVIAEYVPEIVSDAVLLLGVLLLLYCSWKKGSPGEVGRLAFDLVALCVGIASYVLSGETIPLTNIVLLLAIQRCGEGKMLAFIWIGVVSLFLVGGLLELLMQLMFAPDQLRLVVKEGGELAARLLFVHPNACAGYMLMLEITALVVAEKRGTPARVVLTGVFSLLILVITKSKTSFILSLAVMLACVLEMIGRLSGPRFIKYTYKIAVLLPIILTVTTFLIAGPFFQEGMEMVLTNRVGLWRGEYLKNGITLFGSQFVNGVIQYEGGTMHVETLDSAYAEYLFTYGLAGLGVTYLIWLLELKDSGLLGRPFVCVLLAVTLLYGVTETHGLNLLFAFPLVIPCTYQAALQERRNERYKYYGDDGV